MRIGIITGASRGIGKAIAEQSGAYLDRLIILGRSAPIWDAAVPPFDFIQADFSGANHEWLKALEAGLVRLAPSKIFFFDNAASFDIVRTGDTDFVDGLAHHLRVNLFTGAEICSRLTRFASQCSAQLTILHLTTGAAHRPFDGWGHYCITKAAAARYYDVLAVEHPDVRVLQIDPGAVDTGMQQQLRDAPDGSLSDRSLFRSWEAQGKLKSPSSVATMLLERAIG